MVETVVDLALAEEEVVEMVVDLALVEEEVVEVVVLVLDERLC